MNPVTISERYFGELPHLKRALRVCERELSAAARKVDPAAVVTGRVKTHRSVLGKVYRKGGTPRTWESLGDLVALKAVLPTERGMREFTDWVSNRPDLHPVLDPKTSAPNELAYQSMQFDLHCDHLVDSTGTPIKFELQVRTAAVDAWYVVDHRLRYKGAVELPSDLKRKLYRLIVLTELFDEEVEAVIQRQANLPEYAVARLYELLVREVDELIDGHAKASRPEGLLEVILQSYADEELPMLQGTIESFLSTNGSAAKTIMMSHLHEAENFVEARDWIYYEPESLLIAERSLNRPALLKAAIQHSDFESVITPMIQEFQQRISHS